MKKIFMTIGALVLSANIYAANMLTDVQAKNIALGQTTNGRVTKIELDHENGRKVYEIEVFEGNIEKDFKIDAYTGEILRMESEVKYNNEAVIAANSNLISMEDAKQIALKNSKTGGKIKSIELDNDHGYPIYEIEVQEGMFTEREFKIDARNGSILQNKLD